VQNLAAGLGALSLLLLIAVAVLRSKLARARAEAAAALAAPKPPRVVEGREERFGLLWFPTLTIDDAAKKVTAVAPGKPYCPRCLKPLSLAPGPSGEWLCSGCEERRAGSAADMQVVDQIVAQALKEFLARNPEHRAAPGVGVPQRSAPQAS
jgi:ribosomal protein L37AE/L43A